MVSKHKRAGKGKPDRGTVTQEVLPPKAEREQLAFLFNAGRHAELESLAQQLIASYPHSGFVWMLLGLSLHVQGKDGVSALRKAAALSPDDAEIHNNLGNVLWERGEFDAAEASCRQAVQIAPEFAMAHNNLGNALRALGRLDEALACFRRAVAIMPDYAAAHANLGNTLRDLGQNEAAMASCQRALEIAPDFPPAYLCLGCALQDTKQFVEAETMYRRALEFKPDFADAHNNLAAVLRVLGRLDEAAASARRALECQPDFADAACNLGLMLRDLGQLSEAEKYYRRALALKPDLPMAWNNLGTLKVDVGQLDESIENFRKTLTLAPDYAEGYGNLLFALNYHPDKSAEEIFSAYQEYDARFGLPHREGWRAHGNLRQADKRLKIGYVSPDFRHHSCRYFLEPLLSHHNKRAVEVTAYAELVVEDEVTRRYKGYVDHWVVISGLTDDALAERIRADGIDILVDLAGHTSKNRLGVFARKPAPVQVSWLGYGYTTGLTAIDYLLTDSASAPEGSEGLFSEQPWRLETPCYAYRPAEAMGAPGPLPAMRKGYVTYGTLTRAIRLNDKVIRAWSEILQRVPGSRLLVDSSNYPESGAQENLKAKFAAHGIGAQRLEIGYHSPPWDILREIDIGLDCFPHNSGTTLFETLYMGIPYITLAGRPSVGRLGSSVLHGIGHPEWITESEAEYIEKAVALAGDLDKLSGLRGSLRAEMVRSALMDEAGFTRRVEAAYRQMWEKWCATGKSSKSDKPAKPIPRTADRLPQSDREQLIALYSAGRFADLESCSRKLLESYPDSGTVWKVLAFALQSQGKEALAGLRKAETLLPEDADIRNNLGNTLRELGRLEEAMESYHRALELKPDYAEAYYNLGNALEDVGRYGEAAKSHRRALELKPDFVGACYNLGNNLRRMGEIEAAISSYRRALALQPDFAQGWCNLGGALQEQGLLEDAIINYQHALELAPLFADAYSNLLFALNYHPEKSAEEIFLAYRGYDERHGLPHRKNWRPHDNPCRVGKRLKIGYVSPDFRHHSCRYFLEPLLSHHDKKQVEVTAYAEQLGEDQVTRRYKSYVDHWVVTIGLSDDALAERIRRDGIDILIDLAGHTDKNRLGVFARKPAPVSLSWLGYGYTTGLTAIDYLLTDDISAPEGSEGLFSESPWRLATPCYAYRPAEGMGEPGPQPAGRKGHITFGTLTRAVRLNGRVIRTWSEILKRAKGSRLIVDSSNYREKGMQEKLKSAFAAYGIAPERLDVGYHSPPWDTLREIDIGLDCFPHNSGTTLFETLYMGIPYITLAGRPSVGRLGSSILHGLGRTEWIAETEEEYIEKAAALAGDRERLTDLRRGLRGEMEHSALMDEAGFARKVENAYRQMWENWCEAGRTARQEPAQPESLPRKGGRESRETLVEKRGGSAVAETVRVDRLPQDARERLVELYQAGRHAEMESHARRLLETYPDSGMAWKGLSAALQVQGKAAMTELKRAAELLPDDADVHNNLGNALQATGQPESALHSFHRALEINPHLPEAHNNLGKVLSDTGCFDEAIISYRRALEIKPDFLEAHSNLGLALKEIGKMDEAVASCRRALEINPGYSKAHNNLGNALKDLGCLEDAVCSYRRALALDPEIAEIHSNFLSALNQDVKGREEEIRAACREYNRRFKRWDGQPHPNERNPEKRLRIGYVSPDFRRHAVAYFAEPVLSNHGRKQVEIYCYAEIVREDDYTERFRKLADHWRSTVGLSDEAVAEQIRTDRIDILVDLAGHTAGNRLPVFGRKPAPVQITWLGYPGTTGLSTMDYRLTDRHTDPEGEADGRYVEKLLRLPDSLWCYRPSADMPETNSLPALQNGHLTFGSFNNYNKIDRDTIALWSALLQAIPDARLKLLTVPEGDVRQKLLNNFAERGVAAERLDLYGPLPMEAFHRQFLEADIALDPVNINGGTTTCEALWMGLPVLSLTGKRFLSRAGLSILNTVGMTDFAAPTPEELIRVAVYLNDNRDILAEIRTNLRGHVAASPLTDEAGFARHLEAVYRDVWQRWCAGESPAAPNREGGGKGDEGNDGSGQLFARATQMEPALVRTTSAYDNLPQRERERMTALFKAGQYAELEKLADQLSKRYSDSGTAWKVLGVAQRMQGKDGLHALRMAVQQQPDDPDAHNNLGNALRDQGQLDEALAHYHRVLATKPDFAEAHYNQGCVLEALGREDEAVQAFSRAVELKPDFAQAHYNLGNVLRKLCELDAALSSYQRALAIQPDFALCWSNLGVVQQALGMLDEAVASYQRAIALCPEDGRTHSHLGIALHALGRLDEAIASGRRALELAPDFAEGWSNLGVVLQDAGQIEEALICHRHALKISPGHVDAWCNLGLVQQDFGRLDEALESFNQALKINPDFSNAHSNLLFCINLMPEMSAEQMLHAAQEFGARASARSRPYSHWQGTADAERPLHIGFVSGDLRTHPVGYFFESVLAALARQTSGKYVLFAYHNYANPDALTERLARHMHVLRPVVGLSDAALAELIHSDAIDILIDLSGHTAHNRLPVFSWKPAPVQVTWLGYFATTGVTEIDWLIADPYTLPESDAVHFTEKIWRLPETRLCFTPPEEATDLTPAIYPLSRSEEEDVCSYLPSGGDLGGRAEITFGCFNNLAKMNDTVVATWVEILQALPASRLFLKSKQLADAAVCAATQARFTACGIVPQRLILEGPSSRADYLAAYRRIEITLDPFPYPGGTTTAESLWMGVPVLTLAGDRFVARQGLGLLMNAGLPDWVASDRADYVRRAVHHAGDPTRLARLRQGLRNQVLASPLFDAERFAGHFNTALRQMWGKWCEPEQGAQTKPALPKNLSHQEIRRNREISVMNKNRQAAMEGIRVDRLPKQKRNHLDTLFNAGQYAKLEKLADQLSKRYPDSGHVWMMLGLALREQGKDGLPSLHKAAALSPDSAEIHGNLGNFLWEKGKLDEAVKHYREALAIKPHAAEVHYNLGCILEVLERENEAIQAFSRAVELKPDFAGAHYNLGNVRKKLGLLDMAAASYRRALELKPDHVAAQVNLGNVLRDRGLLDEALASYRQALKIKPDFAVIHNNLCDIFRVLGQYDEAVTYCHRALELDPGFAEAHANLANVFKEQGKADEAVTAFQQALKINPDYSIAHANLGNLLLSLGRLSEAAESFRRSLEIDPGIPDVHSNLLFALNLRVEENEEEIGTVCREYGRRFNCWDGQTHPNSRDPDKRLRIGYVSPDFRRHAVAYFAEPVLANHDRCQVEIYCYAKVMQADDFTERFQRLADHWRSTVGLSDEAVAEQIRTDRIDILVDLAGHTAGNRLPVFGRKPAPVQITWLGYPGTTGLSTMDYRLTDRHTDPEGEADGLYVEKLLRLPDSLWCYRPSADMPETNSLPALQNGHLTFGSFNNYNRVDRETINLWSALLREVPGSRLLMLTVPEGETRRKLLRAFAEQGVEAARLELHGALPREAFLRKFHEADIALDPVNINGGTTTCEALWMGLPVLSLTGRRFLSRAGLSILSTVGMADFAVATPQDYLRVAAYLNENRDLLAEIRANLRGYMAASPLTDEVTFTRRLEGIFREVWRKWCAAV